MACLKSGIYFSRGAPAGWTLQRIAWLLFGDTLALQFAPGRFSGLFVTGWQALPPGQP